MSDSNPPPAPPPEGSAADRAISGEKVLLVIALLALVFAIADWRSVSNLDGSRSAWQVSRLSAARDFYQVWWPARMTMLGDSVDLYAPDVREALGNAAISEARQPDAGGHLRAAAQFSADTYPHYFASTFTPVMVSSYAIFAFDDYDVARKVFALASLIAFVGGLLLLCRLAGVGWPGALAITALTIWIFQPLRNDIIDGNVNRLQLGGLALYLWLTVTRRHLACHVAAGVLVGWLILFKPNLALLPIFMSAALVSAGPRPRWLAQWGGIAIAGLLAVVVPAVLFGAPSMWLGWLERMKQIHGTPYPVEADNLATARLILEATGLNLSLPLAAVLIAAGIAICAWLARRTQAVSPRLALLTAGLAVMTAIIASQLAWPHYFLLLLPLLLAACRPDGLRLTPSLAVIAVLYLILAERHLRSVIDLSNMTYGWLVTLAMLAAAGLAIYQLLKTQAADTAPESAAHSET